jgi:hypothetical protein
VTKDPKMLQFIGGGLKDIYGDNIWCDKTLKDLDNKSIVICDVRHKVEAEKLKQIGIPILRINRKDRPIDRDPTHISEIDLDDYMFEYMIDNDGTIEELYSKIDQFILSVRC